MGTDDTGSLLLLLLAVLGLSLLGVLLAVSLGGMWD